MVLDLITRLAQQNVAVLVISHNLSDAMAVADRIAVMYLGTMAAVGPKDQFDNQSIVDLMTTGTSSRMTQGGTSEQ
jgi:ABC-type sugar transport system ATPase subunit